MLAPKYLCDMISIYTLRRRLRSCRDKYLLNVPKVRTGFGERAFSYSGPKIWNDLPYDVRASECLNSFKQKLSRFKIQIHLFIKIKWFQRGLIHWNWLWTIVEIYLCLLLITVAVIMTTISGRGVTVHVIRDVSQFFVQGLSICGPELSKKLAE